MYTALWKVFRTYWAEYGGFSEFNKSPFFHFSIVFSLFHSFGIIDLDWVHLSTGSLPTILGFSLAAYTITFSLMGSSLHRALSKAIDEKSGIPLISSVNATFFHVIMFKSLALIYALATGGLFFWKVFGGHPSIYNLKEIVLGVIVYGGDFVGCSLSIYSIFLLFSVAIAMFRLGRLSSYGESKSGRMSEVSHDATQVENNAIINSLRFKIVTRVAKILRVYG